MYSFAQSVCIQSAQQQSCTHSIQKASQMRDLRAPVRMDCDAASRLAVSRQLAGLRAMIQVCSAYVYAFSDAAAA